LETISKYIHQVKSINTLKDYIKWKGLQNRQEEIDALKDNIAATAADEGGNTLYESKTRFRFIMYFLY
jgi:hypothetical protein